jgi:hypothetical protein
MRSHPAIAYNSSANDSVARLAERIQHDLPDYFSA